MKIIFALAGLCALVLADPVTPQKKVKDDCKIQKEMKDLLYYITQPRCSKTCLRAEGLNQENLEAGYKDPKDVDEFLYYQRHSPIRQGEAFSVFNHDQLKQAIALFKLFYNAPDAKTLVQNACWARLYVNEGMYLYALSVAILHRPDTAGCQLPKIYELYPYFFFSSETIAKAHYYKQLYHGEAIKETVTGDYSRHNLNLRDHNVLSYFIEDIELNAYYYDYSVRYPFWMGSEYISKEDRRGELFYTVHQQLLARLYMEKLSNDLGTVGVLDWTSPIEPEFRPSLQYHNGIEFPERPSRMVLKHHPDFNNPYQSNYTRAYTYVHDYARRIRDAIDLGYVYDSEGKKISFKGDQGFEILADLIEGNPDSPNIDYYGDIQRFARYLLGHTHLGYDKNRTAPSALMHYETSLRDPVFYQYYKWIITYMQEYKMHLPSYTEKDLAFPGVEVQNFEVLSPLSTYFEWTYTNLRNGIFYQEDDCGNEKIDIEVRQLRLNHESFIYKLSVSSQKAVDSIVRVFIGPKYDEHGRIIDMNENRMNFFEIDRFEQKLKAGKTDITRSSTEIRHPVAFTSWGFPHSYLLPKGKVGGQDYQIYVIVSKPSSDYETTTRGDYEDNRPSTYPFDRYIDESVFYVPNAIFKDIKIYHKEQENSTL